MKKKEITIKHVVEDRTARIYVETDILAKTIMFGRGMKRMRFTLWEAEHLEFLLKRQIDRLKGDYPKKVGGENKKDVEEEKKIADVEVQVQNQQLPLDSNLDEESRRKRECLNLAKKFHVPLSVAIEHYDILSKTDT